MAQGGAHMARAARSLGTQRRALAPVRVGAPAPRRASAPRARSLATAPVARTETLFLEPGFKAPAFALAEPATGKTVDLYTYAAGAPATVVMIICNHCERARGLARRRRFVRRGGGAAAFTFCN